MSEFKLGDVVRHKSDHLYRKWVVSGLPTSDGGAYMIKRYMGDVDKPTWDNNGFNVVSVQPFEIELVDNKAEVMCCDGPCYAAENAGELMSNPNVPNVSKMTTDDLLQAAADALIGEDMDDLADEVFAVLDQYEGLTDED